MAKAIGIDVSKAVLLKGRIEEWFFPEPLANRSLWSLWFFIQFAPLCDRARVAYNSRPH